MTSLIGALVVAAALGIVNAPVAQAQPSYTCPVEGAKTIELNDGSASATVYVNENCSDGQAHYSGVVRDIKCDDRPAYLLVDYLPLDTPVMGWIPRSVEFDAPDGCNSEATFSFDIDAPDPFVEACVVADTWWSPAPTSETDCTTL
jgi:hypothetical protein